MSDFLNKIRTITLPQDAILVSFDVTSLYTSITHKRGMRFVGKALNTTELSDECKEFFMGLLEIVLTCNSFQFEGNCYIQWVTAMGTNVAPTYANMVMADLEEGVVYVSHHFASVTRWRRYIYKNFLILTNDVSLDS